MKYIRIITITFALLCLLCACTQQQPPQPPQQQTQTGTQYQSSWVTGISKESASANAAVSEWLTLCADSERDSIGHYVLRRVCNNGDGTSTHHLLIYRSATEADFASFDVSFEKGGDMMVVTPTYTSSDKSLYGYDLIYLTLTTDSNVRVLVELLVDSDYPGQIITTTDKSISPDTFG